MKGSLVPCGHTFSDFQIYDEKTAKEECIKMVRNIMEYWKAEAARNAHCFFFVWDCQI